MQKLENQLRHIAQIGQQLQANNDQNLAQIDSSYQETAQLEKQFIDKKMENMNLINESEMEGIKFLHQFGETTRETESLNSQINQIQHIVALLQNELAQAETEQQNMDDVFSQEQQLLLQRDTMSKENEKRVSTDLKEQIKDKETELSEIDGIQTKQSQIYEGLTQKQQVVLDDLEKQTLELEKERTTLLSEREQLHVKVRQAKQENLEKENKNRLLEGQIKQLTVKIEAMEDNLDALVLENNSQFSHHNDIIEKNNKNIYNVREDFGKVQRQHFEMGHINETLEQRIDQLKGQRDLSILLNKAGLQNDLKSQQADAERNSQNLIALHNNTEQSW